MNETEVISLRLGAVEEMFETPEWDGVSPPVLFEPGIDVCISELRVGVAPVHPCAWKRSLPSQRSDPATLTHLQQWIGRYCEDRIANDRACAGPDRDGYASKVGIPIALVGLAIVVATAVANTNDDYTLPNLAGWVLAWVGLWYPLDTILFSSVLPKRENGVLLLAGGAEVAITPYRRRRYDVCQDGLGLRPRCITTACITPPLKRTAAPSRSPPVAATPAPRLRSPRRHAPRRRRVPRRQDDRR